MKQRKKIKSQLFNHVRPHMEILDTWGEPRLSLGNELWNILGKVIYLEVEAPVARYLETIRITSDIVNKIDTQ